MREIAHKGDEQAADCIPLSAQLRRTYLASKISSHPRTDAIEYFAKKETALRFTNQQMSSTTIA